MKEGVSAGRERGHRGKVSPAAELVGPQFFRIGAMDHDRSLKGIVKELEITVCLP